MIADHPSKPKLCTNSQNFIQLVSADPQPTSDWAVATMTIGAEKSIKHAPFPEPGTQSSQLASTDSRYHGQAHFILRGKNTINKACRNVCGRLSVNISPPAPHYALL